MLKWKQLNYLIALINLSFMWTTSLSRIRYVSNLESREMIHLASSCSSKRYPFPDAITTSCIDLRKPTSGTGSDIGPRTLFLFTRDDEEINKKTRGSFSRLSSRSSSTRQMLQLLDHFSMLLWLRASFCTYHYGLIFFS